MACFTRMDIMYYLNLCMRHISGASEQLYANLLTILHYLAVTSTRKLTYGCNANDKIKRVIIDNCDSIRLDIFDEADPITMVDTGDGPKPMQCAYITIYGSIVAARNNRLKLTTMSQCESEYFGATTGATMLQALAPILDFINVKYKLPMVIFCDNKAACMLSDNNTSSRRMKHVARRIAYLQDLVSKKKVCLVHIRTEGNLADIGTKALPARTFHQLTSHIWEP